MSPRSWSWKQIPTTSRTLRYDIIFITLNPRKAWNELKRENYIVLCHLLYVNRPYMTSLTNFMSNQKKWLENFCGKVRNLCFSSLNATKVTSFMYNCVLQDLLFLFQVKVSWNPVKNQWNLDFSEILAEKGLKRENFSNKRVSASGWYAHWSRSTFSQPWRIHESQTVKFLKNWDFRGGITFTASGFQSPYFLCICIDPCLFFFSTKKSWAGMGSILFSIKTEILAEKGQKREKFVVITTLSFRWVYLLTKTDNPAKFQKNRFKSNFSRNCTYI